MMRVGVLRGGLEVESEKAIPPSQRLEIMRGQAIAQLRAQATKESIPTTHRADSEVGDWGDIKGLPSPPLSTGQLGSEDEATEECSGLNLTRQ